MALLTNGLPGIPFTGTSYDVAVRTGEQLTLAEYHGQMAKAKKHTTDRRFLTYFCWANSLIDPFQIHLSRGVVSKKWGV